MSFLGRSRWSASPPSTTGTHWRSTTAGTARRRGSGASQVRGRRSLVSVRQTARHGRHGPRETSEGATPCRAPCTSAARSLGQVLAEGRGELCPPWGALWTRGEGGGPSQQRWVLCRTERAGDPVLTELPSPTPLRYVSGTGRTNQGSSLTCRGGGGYSGQARCTCRNQGHRRTGVCGRFVARKAVRTRTREKLPPACDVS